MPTPTLSEEKKRHVRDLLAQGYTQQYIATHVGVSKGSVHNVKQGLGGDNSRKHADPARENTRTDDFGKDEGSITLRGTRICTLEQMIEHCKIDLTIWEVERFVCNKWEVGAIPRATKEHSDTSGQNSWIRPHRLDTPAAEPMQNETRWNGGLLRVYPLFQVKVWLKKKAAPVLAIHEALEEFKREAAKHAPKFPPQIVKMRSKYSTGVWVEHSIVDHHFGALIWDKETGRGDYDLSIASQCWRDAIIANCDRTDAYKPEGILYPIGNDQSNADNRQGSTEKGTPQSMDSRYQKVTRVSRDETKWAIDQFLVRYGRVHVVPVPGNHDPLTTFHLGDYLEAWYRNDKRITVDTRPLFRKYWELGVVGIGFLHGNTGKLERYGMTFAAEEPEMWGRTRWREMHSADKHQRSLIEFDGYAVRILPSLRPPCAWSSENMLGAIRASESYVWSKTEGLIGNATFSILPKGGK